MRFGNKAESLTDLRSPSRITYRRQAVPYTTCIPRPQQRHVIPPSVGCTVWSQGQHAKAAHGSHAQSPEHQHPNQRTSVQSPTPTQAPPARCGSWRTSGGRDRSGSWDLPSALERRVSAHVPRTRARMSRRGRAERGGRARRGARLLRRAEAGWRARAWRRVPAGRPAKAAGRHAARRRHAPWERHARPELRSRGRRQLQANALCAWRWRPSTTALGNSPLMPGQPCSDNSAAGRQAV